MKHKLLSILLCLAMALSLLPTAALAEGETGAGPIKVGETSYSSFSDAVNAAEPDGSGVITYEISGKVDVTATGWVQVAKAGLTGPTKVEFVGKTGDAEICITGGLAILADQKYDIDVSFTNLKLSKPNPTYGGDYGHSTNYFTCWLRNTGAAENTVTYTNCTFPNGVCNNQYGKTVFNNCKFTNNTAGLSNLWNYGGETKVEECTFTGTRGIKMYNEGTLQNPPSIEIKNTNFTGMTEKAAIAVSKAANVTLNTVGATDCTMGLLQKDIEGSTDEQKVTIEANGTGISGDFNITAQKDAEAAKNEFNITAGTFAGEINNDYLAPGANFDATTGEVKMSYVAKIGDTEYPTLADAFAAANKTGDTVIELLDDINMTGKNWTPVEVDGYHGQGVITLNGNGKTITGLSAPLFAGGFAGKSGIVIKDLTIADADIDGTTNNLGIGAFINCVDSMTRIELDNCHLKNSKIVSTGDARVGGLIGWTSGYNKPNDGPVDTKVTLTNCSVENVTIEAKGSVGGLIGHAGANPATYHTITGCTVKDSTLKCTETGKSWRVGDLVGTANVGQVTVDAATSASQNFLTQENASTQKPEDSIFGRKEVGTDGLMIIDNKVVAAGTAYGDIVNKNANEVLVEVSKGHWVKPKEDTVAMIGAKEYPTLTAAINEANTGDTVKLVNNVTVTKPIEVTKSMTLDLNGHVLTAATASTATVKNSAIWVTAEKVNLTIDGTTAGSGMTMGDTHDTNWEAKVWGFVDLREGSAGSTVTVNGGSYTGSTCASDSYHYTALFTVGSESKLVLNNVSAETDERVVKASSCGEVVVSGGTYNITGINAFLGAAFETKTASFTDMKLTAKYGGCVQVGRNATLENCEIKVTDIRTGDGTYLNCAVAVQYGGTATVKSGTYTAPYAAYVYNSGGTINIENGTFTGVVRADATTDTTAVINIKNGSFNGEIQKGGGPGSETISITGGTFSFDPSTKVKNNGTDYIVKRAGSEGAYTYTVLAKSDLTSGVYLTDPSGALASNYYVSSTANGVWTVSYSAPSSGGGSSSSSRRYDVSAPSVKHGDVTVSPKSASKGDTVTITVKPDSGYELDTLTVKDASGSKIKVKDKGDGKFTFTMPASKVTVSAEFAEIETLDFADVPTDAYYYEAVKWAAKKGITGGIGNGLFGPNQPCTRAQIVTFLWRAAGSPEPKTMSSFADVSMDAYYAKAVAWAVENGITTGTGDGKFSPDATCTRAQSVTFLFRAIGKLVDSKAEFSDVLADSYYANAVDWAVENGVTNGIGDGLFGPDNSCTRAQIVTFLYRAYQGK
ncbi:S-layer homology domain-containing protein [Dysosmobacter sp.]|uniref:S-layer homology domain-containing protein n=1 Tax=Dysosmobacter sp. TaxID=2591382 RepID=UPI003AB5164C